MRKLTKKNSGTCLSCGATGMTQVQLAEHQCIIETVLGRITENKTETDLVVKVKGQRTEYPIAISVDWKADPSEVMKEVNRYLSLQGSNIRFTHVDCGDDQYTFITAYKK